MSAVRKCIWCGKSEHIMEVRFNKKDRITIPFCSDECVKDARSFLEFDAKYSRTFYVLEFTLAFACLVLTLSKLVFFGALAAAFIGLVMIPLPFVAAIMGGRTFIKRAILGTRALGVAVAVVSLGIAYLFRP